MRRAFFIFWWFRPCWQLSGGLFSPSDKWKKNIPTNCFAVSIWHGNLYQAKYSGLPIEHILSFELITICEKCVFMEVTKHPLIFCVVNEMEYVIKLGRISFFSLGLNSSPESSVLTGWEISEMHPPKLRSEQQGQRYTYRVLQTIQMKLILLCVLAERAVLGSAKTALKFKYEI